MSTQEGYCISYLTRMTQDSLTIMTCMATLVQFDDHFNGHSEMTSEDTFLVDCYFYGGHKEGGRAFGLGDN